MIAVQMETELFQRVRAGDADALAEVFSRYGDLVYGVALRITASREDAEDVLHDILLGLPEAVGRVGAPKHPPSWLRTVAVRRSLDVLRVRRRRREDALASDIEEVAGRSADRLDAIAVERALRSLPDKLRVVLVLKEVEGYSHAEIGTILGIGESASEVRLYRAKRKLRDLLRDDS